VRLDAFYYKRWEKQLSTEWRRHKLGIRKIFSYRNANIGSEFQPKIDSLVAVCGAIPLLSRRQFRRHPRTSSMIPARSLLSMEVQTDLKHCTSNPRSIKYILHIPLMYFSFSWYWNRHENQMKTNFNKFLKISKYFSTVSILNSYQRQCWQLVKHFKLFLKNSKQEFFSNSIMMLFQTLFFLSSRKILLHKKKLNQ